MEAKTYKGITFASDYSKSFEDFKKDFENTHVFKKVPSSERETEMAKAYETATGKKADSKPVKPVPEK